MPKTTPQGPHLLPRAALLMPLFCLSSLAPARTGFARASAAAPAYPTSRVVPACDPLANRPVATADHFTAACGSLLIAPAQLLAYDTNPLGGPFQEDLLAAPPSNQGRLVANADGSLRFVPAPGFIGTASFTYQTALRDQPDMIPHADGHYYEYVSAPGICWTAARAAAAGRTYRGLQGYLATMTSAGEQATVHTARTGPFWPGGTDAAVEGDWRWQSGPEAGQRFWRGGPTGTGQGFSNWMAGQPDDLQNPYRPAGEYYTFLYGGSGLWNDYSRCVVAGPDTYRYITGCLVEYGGLEACRPSLLATGTVTINVGGAAARALAAGNHAAALAVVLEALPRASSACG